MRLMQRLRVPYGSLGACTPHETAYQLCTTCSLLHECALFRFSIPVAPLPRATHACRVLQGASTDQTSVPHCAGRLRRHVHACRTPFICSLAPVNPQHPICRPAGSTERASATRHSSSFSKLSAATTAQRERSVFKLGGSDSRIDAKGMGAGSGGNGGDFRGEGDEGANASNSPAKGGAWGKGLAGKRCWILLCVKNCKRAPMLLSRRGIKKMCVCAPPPPTVVTLRPQICVIVRVGVEV